MKNHEPQASPVSSEELDSDDSDSESHTVAKALNAGSDLKKRKSKPSSDSSPKPPAKRKRATNTKTSKRKKSPLFQRLWSDMDEIVILKGILEYQREKGADPMADTVALHHLIKDSLHAEFDRRQMVDKIRKLKMRYTNSVSNKKKNFTPHELSTFELSSKIWGDHKDDAVADQQTESNRKTATVLKAKASKGVNKPGYSFQFIGKSSISMGWDENIVKLGLEMCSLDKKAEMEDKWKQFYMEESDLLIRKLDLAHQEGKMIVESLKSGGNN